MQPFKKLVGLAALVTALSGCGDDQLFPVEPIQQEKEPPIINPIGEPQPYQQPPDSSQPDPSQPEYLPPQLACRRENCSQNFIIDGITGRITQEIIQVAQEQDMWYTLRLFCLGACYTDAPPTSPIEYGPDVWANQQCYLINDYTASHLPAENPDQVRWFFDSEPGVYAPLNDCLPLPNNVQFMLLYADIPYFDGSLVPAYEGEVEFCLIPHDIVVLEE